MNSLYYSMDSLWYSIWTLELNLLHYIDNMDLWANVYRQHGLNVPLYMYNTESLYYNIWKHELLIYSICKSSYSRKKVGIVR